MTDQEREREIRRREAEATPGPWTVEHHGSHKADETYYSITSPENKALFDTINSDAAELHNERDEDGSYWWDEAGRRNLAFAAHAREDVPWLLQQLDQARAQLAERDAENGRLRQGLGLAIKAIDGLADQQAMPDYTYLALLDQAWAALGKDGGK